MKSDRPNQSVHRTEELAFKLFEAELAPAEKSELDRLLVQDQDCVHAFTRYADTHALLAFSVGLADSSMSDSADKDDQVFSTLMATAWEERRKADLQAFAEKQLEDNMAAALMRRHKDESIQVQAKPPHVLVIPRWLVYAAGTALAAVIAIAIYPFLATSTPSTPHPDPSLSPIVQSHPPMARLLNEHDAVWSHGSQLHGSGGILDLGQYELTKGFAELGFAEGASIILKAPVTLRIVSASECELDKGLLKATVPPGAEGFTVVTPTGRVVDLGTEFGVEVRDDGSTRIDVMTGRVIGQANQQSVSRELVAGQATVLTESITELVLMDTRAEAYPEQWSDVSNQIEVRGSGSFLFAHPSTLQEGQYESDNRIVLFRERESLRLSEDLPLSIIDTGKFERFPKTDQHAIPAGTEIDSYLLHFDAVGTPLNVVESTATFTFEKPILGLIVSHQGLADTDARLAVEGVSYPTANTATRGFEGLEHSGMNKVLDMVQISQDRKRLTVRMGTTNLIDQARVILQAHPETG